MRARRMAIGLLALAALGFVASSAHAGDTVRLSLSGDTSAQTLNLKATADDLAADTVAAHGGYRGGYGGYRGGYGGYRGGYGGYRGGYGGYRGGYGGYYGGYRGYYQPYYSYYTPSYYSYYPTYSGYTYSSNVYYSPVAELATALAQPQTTVLRPAASGYELPPPMLQADEQPRIAPSQQGTYPYDGGPQRSIPMPPAEEMPVNYPRLSKPALVEDLVVKMPAKSSGKWNYPAYGEAPSR